VYLVQLAIQLHLLEHLIVVLWFIHLHSLPLRPQIRAKKFKKSDMQRFTVGGLRGHTTIAYTLALKNVNTNPVFLSSDLNASKIRDVGCPAISAISPDTYPVNDASPKTNGNGTVRCSCL
jgi:hypothetical protein